MNPMTKRTNSQMKLTVSLLGDRAPKKTPPIPDRWDDRRRPRRAIVAFHDDAEGFWPWFFGRPGFRHCLVAVNDGERWIQCDPCHDRMGITTIAGSDFDLEAFYRSAGYRVIETHLRSPGRGRWAPKEFSCVEAVKRILGIHDWWLWTPHQLYRYLRNGG